MLDEWMVAAEARAERWPELYRPGALGDVRVAIGEALGGEGLVVVENADAWALISSAANFRTQFSDEVLDVALGGESEDFESPFTPDPDEFSLPPGVDWVLHPDTARELRR